VPATAALFAGSRATTLKTMNAAFGQVFDFVGAPEFLTNRFVDRLLAQTNLRNASHQPR
jgi:hypothetical protein